ncbi:hypothetical protein M3Y94_00018700 [Aphelenchoides besseyi]|nr:hypothetical protein M3Y94_00018700 [Aphelenchoides besseyi]KAI6216501.1 hypothetical protein M3Y95_01271600 [Aphelenchoides besseyi]
MSNFDPELHSQLNYFYCFNFILSTLLFPPLVYVIISKSSKLGKYKRYLLNSTVWSYVTTALLYIINPIYLSPSLCVVSDSVLPLTYYQFILANYLLLFCVINLGMSIIYCFLYRFSQAYHNLISGLLDNSPWTELFYAVVHLLIQTIVLGTVYVHQNHTKKQTREQFAIENPDLVAYFNDRLVICFANTNQSRQTLLYCFIILFSFFLLLKICLCYFVYRLYTNKRHLNSKQLQLMLFKVLMIQLIVVDILLFFPANIICILTYFQYPRTARYTQFTIAFVGVHCWMDYLIMAYFVVPYREAILKALRSLSSQVHIVH